MLSIFFSKNIKQVKVLVALSFLMSSTWSCLRSIDLNLPDINEKILVVDGQFTDLNFNNYVRLSWARGTKDTFVTPVDNAVVIVTSSTGEVDTLLRQDTKPKYQFDKDTIFQGYYYSKRIKCVAQSTYHLKILIEDKTYEAESYMPKAPNLDKVSIHTAQSDKNGTEYHPLLFFKEPRPEKNYYMTQMCDGNLLFNSANVKRLPCEFTDRVWNVALIDDSHLPAYVDGLNVNVGTTPSPYLVLSLTRGESYNALLYSITKDAYEHYLALVKSLRSDGGVYSPTPSNAPTNLRSKHPVIGFFNTMGVSYSPFKVDG